MSSPVQTEPYVDLRLLECSRKRSVDVSGGNDTNNAIFMNKVEEGMMLNVGDKISVHSAVISEIGAGSDTIELKGNLLERISIPKLIRQKPYNLNEQYLQDGYTDVLNTYDAVVVDRVSRSHNLKDNNVFLTIEYFKTTNGENCFSLPRRFGAITNKTAYNLNDAPESGATTQQPRNGAIVETDYYRDRNASSRWNGTWVDNRELLKIRQDGTKFTLFTRGGTTWYNLLTTQPSAPTMQYFANGNGSIDPAVATYYLYRESKEITIPEGRRSADFIAETFTNSLQNGSSLQKYYQWITPHTNPSLATNYQGQGVLAGVYKTDTYKPFNCANSDFAEFTYNQARQYEYSSGEALTLQVLEWINSFQNVCFKRPDFVETGRQDFGNGNFYGGTHYKRVSRVSSDSRDDRLSMRISFNVSYTKTNVESWAKWIKTQELYPEFWDFRNASGSYHQREFTETRNIETYLTAGEGVNNFLIDVTPLGKLSLDNPYAERTITVTSAFLSPTTCNIVLIENPNSISQRIYIDGVTIIPIPSNTEMVYTITDVYPTLSSDNSRFFHLDMVQAYEPSDKTTCSDRKEFGSDQNASTSTLATALKYNTPSQPLFCTYIKEQEDTFYENPIYSPTSKELSYGLFLKDENGNIQITMEGVGGVPANYYNASGFFIGGTEAVGNGSYNLDKYRRFIGYDPHFTAYGNAAIGLYTPSASGVCEKENNLQIGFVTQNELGAGDALGNLFDRGKIINQVYLGSSNPKLVYDSIKDRFGFKDFYTPEYLGNNGGAGSDSDNNPVRDGKAVVYKINKRTLRQNYAPGMNPYPEKLGIKVKDTAGVVSSNDLNVDLPNRNIFPFSIIDSQSGISIQSFGISEEKWNDSLLGILGFTYNQLQSSVSASNTTQTRVNTFNSKSLNKVTTESIIAAQDTLVYNMNIWGAEMYKPNIATAQILHDYQNSKKFYQYFPPIVVDSDSITITAEGVPRQMLNPFYTIRSDIVDEAAYFGSLDSGERLPVVSHVLKQTDGGDFFYSSDSSLEFTITRQKPLSTITTAICDPDGSFARVDDNSAVIYKVQRNNQFPVNLIASLFGNQK